MTARIPNEIRLIAVRIGSQDFGIDMMSVREIRAWSEPTPLPQSPHYVRGMIQLRGAVIPVIDLRDRLGLGSTLATATTVMVVVENRHRAVGLLVDAVCDLCVLPMTALQPAPHLAGDLPELFVTATATIDGRILSVISLDSVVPDQLNEAA